MIIRTNGEFDNVGVLKLGKASTGSISFPA